SLRLRRIGRISLPHNYCLLGGRERIRRRYLEDYQLKDCEIIGHSHYDVFPEIPDYWRAIHQRCLQGAVEKNEGEPFTRSDGRVDWVRWEIHPWRNKQGEIDGLVLFSEVITERVEALQAFKASEQRYRQMFEMHGLPKLILAPDTGQIINANPAAGRFYGYTVEQLKTLNMADLTLLPPEEVRHKLIQAIHSSIYSIECLHRGADGQPHNVEIFVGLIEFEDRNELYALITDVTERQRTRKALQEAYDLMEQRVIARTIELQRYAAQVQDLYNNAPAGYHSLDANGRFVQVNDTELRWLGYTREEMLGKKTFVDLISPATRPVFDHNFPIFKQQGWIKGLEFELVRKDGTTFPVLIDATAIIDDQGQFVHSRSTVYDMTERKQADDALRIAWQKEHELSELKSRFVSMASHEFRTPLAAILATTETLTIYRDRMNEAQIDARLDKIRQQVMHMKEIMEDVLQLARIQAGRMEFKPLIEDFDALCREIVEEYETQVRQPGRIAYLCPQRPVLAEIDPRLMRQIISNLISNALKYSAPQSQVQVTLQREAHQVVLMVTDQGIGIPPDDLKRMFDPFHRATNVGTIAGTGLGLSITHQAVEMHHGTIQVVSEMDKGTTIRVAIPLKIVVAKDS
ncbi:PAS domain-containing sensor histidine kinase, partial [Candidatus Oscillochloris fontis]|uniref:sensor histidine kinase n=1 Tax=Candidatus Oscillochloris fontis TaxID=2496868 RepID=UPI00101B895A